MDKTLWSRIERLNRQRERQKTTKQRTDREKDRKLQSNEQTERKTENYKATNRQRERQKVSFVGYPQIGAYAQFVQVKRDFERINPFSISTL